VALVAAIFPGIDGDRRGAPVDSITPKTRQAIGRRP